ncbi:MAG: tRNA preQ1(34) S-adenosylmethionine ribosyltransferase-isomerase QueA [Clostridia bacterium]
MNPTSKSTYHYDLPEELIAQKPIEPRDSSRLLCFNKQTKQIEHKIFRQIEDMLEAGDVLVVNNTKVIPARLMGIKEETGAKIEVLLQKRKSLTEWEAIAKPTKRLNIGTKVVFSENLACVVKDINVNGDITINFEFQGVFEKALEEVGETPLPHYIHEKLKNIDRYQTVYCKSSGSSAAPTAGLHFTTELLERIQKKGVIVVPVLLHVGLGTFRPVKEENILEHHMHSEWYSVSDESASIINKAKAEGRRVIAVGTTSVRVLESCAEQKGKIEAKQGETSIFIYPPYDFKIVDAIITNFHLPESTLLMLVSAFASIEDIKNLYKEAVKERYRFFSFGDACFIY